MEHLCTINALCSARKYIEEIQKGIGILLKLNKRNECIPWVTSNASVRGLLTSYTELR